MLLFVGTLQESFFAKKMIEKRGEEFQLFDDINELTKEMSFRKLNNMIITIEEARKNIKSNVSWAMILRVMLMGFMEG